MVRVFEFGGCEAAAGSRGAVNALMRRVPGSGHRVNFEVKPLTVDGRLMKRRLGCRVEISVGLDGEVLDVLVLGSSDCAVSLYYALKRGGVDCYRVG